jgi:Do/DeqQ family serine protease
LQSAFHRISDSVAPSVVQIDVRQRLGEDSAGNPFLDLFGLPDETEPEGRDFQRGATGSGVIVQADARRYYVLTNDHVIGDADAISVVLYDGVEIEAELVGRDPRKDLAMIAFRSNRDLPVAVFGDSDLLRVGDWVVAIGSPYGFQNTITAGIVSALDRRGGPEGNISDFIQTDASINQGNSGGALVNLDGELIGINTWISSDTGGSVGLGFAIPINNVVRSVGEFLDDGDVEYGWLGVSIESVDADQALALGLERRGGALVNSVFTDSPAAVHGLRPGDVITLVGETAISDSDELILEIGEHPAGETVMLSLVRAGAALQVPVELGVRDTEASIWRANRRRWPGFSVYPITQELLDEAALEIGAGVIISSVAEGSAPHIAGMRAADIVTSINGMPVHDLVSFYDLIAEPRTEEWTFGGLRNGEEFQVTVVR